MKTKFPYLLFLLGLVFTATGLMAGLIASSIMEYQLLEKISQGYYSNNAITFTLDNADDASISRLIGILKPGEALYKPLEANVKMVFFRGQAEAMPVLGGRYFTESDFLTGQRLALAGKETELFEDKGKKYFEYSGEKYEVIGTIGIDMPSMLDQMAVINMPATIPPSQIQGLWIVDGDAGLLQSFNERSANENGLDIQILDPSRSGTYRMFRNENVFGFIYSAIWLCLIFCAMSITYYWIDKRCAIIAVQKLCGFSSNQIFFDSFKRYLVVLVTGYGFGVIIYILMQSGNLNQYAGQYLKNICFILLSSMAICILPLTVMIKTWTDRMLRSI